MRTTKELLQLMLKNVKYFEDEGLCYWTKQLYIKRRISYDELISLRGYIERNRPSKFSSIETFRCRNSGYYWQRGALEPRLKWIKLHITKLS